MSELIGVLILALGPLMAVLGYVTARPSLGKEDMERQGTK